MSGITSYNLNPSSIGNGHLFPATIENNEKIGYHGTSSYYSSDIEANGFIQKKPIPTADIDYIISIGNRLSIDTSSASGFKSLQSISFSPLSELALFYAQPRSLGGQGLAFVHQVVLSLLKDASGNIQPDEILEVTRIGNVINARRSADPVVDPVDLSGISKISYDVLTKGIKVFESIPASQIRGRLLVPKNINYSSINTKKLYDKLHNIRFSSAPHFIKTIIR